MSMPEYPDKYTFTLMGGVDYDLDNIRIKELPTIRLESAVKELPVIRTDSKIDGGLDNIRIRELPRIDLQFGTRPTRVHVPLNLKFGISIMGVEIVAFDICGESMVVIEDYKHHMTEQCT